MARLGLWDDEKFDPGAVYIARRPLLFPSKVTIKRGEVVPPVTRPRLMKLLFEQHRIEKAPAGLQPPIGPPAGHQGPQIPAGWATLPEAEIRALARALGAPRLVNTRQARALITETEAARGQPS